MTVKDEAAEASSLFDLTGRRAIVTGASRGIGRAIAVGLADAGANVVAVARSKNGLEETAGLAEHSRGTIEILPKNLRDPAGIEATVAVTVERLGGIDILVNNAADDSASDVIEEVDLSGYQAVLELTLQSTWLMSRAASEHLADGGGKVINVASMLGLVGIAGDSPYVAAKHGVVGLTRALALEWARRDVQVNAIAPGFVRTDMIADIMGDERLLKWVERNTPQRRVAEPSEIVGPAIFLASPASNFITGQVVVVDGGWTAQ